jgi:hypothetical protein
VKCTFVQKYGAYLWLLSILALCFGYCLYHYICYLIEERRMKELKKILDSLSPDEENPTHHQILNDIVLNGRPIIDENGNKIDMLEMEQFDLGEEGEEDMEEENESISE